MADKTIPVPVIQDVINDVTDRQRMRGGVEACRKRMTDFSTELEMQLAGIAMVPEARQLMSDTLTGYWNVQAAAGLGDVSRREIVIGAGFQAAVYAANRVRAGFPRPVILERSDQVGGAFAVSLDPVFRLNSRNRPGRLGLPDQDQALNDLPGGLLQPSMITSDEYPTNADMAWLVRLALAQFADVYTGITVTGIGGGARNLAQLSTSAGSLASVRVLDARGCGQPVPGTGDSVPTFMQLMARMGTMFPLRGMQQVAIRGGGDSARCAIESLLGLAPGHSSVAGLDYVTQVDWYTRSELNPPTCSEFRAAQRGRYIAIAQQLKGNVSSRSTRLRVISELGYATPMADGVLVNDRSYDLAVDCTGGTLPALKSSLSYYPVRAATTGSSRGLITANGGVRGTVLGMQADPIQAYRIGPAAELEFSSAEIKAGIADNPASKVAMFRLAPRTAALAMALPGLDG